ncbi:FlxA-like family protein [Clostridium akagii]|uniref:FlxA-like family protein n=1 Tax=Clostridium akagii TaxID=91623 RepID=UPI000689F998|nr:FlxA-like family protein [Clostridium akagii]
MNISSISNLAKTAVMSSKSTGSDKSSSASTSNATATLDNQKASLQKQLQQANSSGGDAKTRQAKINKIQNQLQTVVTEITQKQSSSSSSSSSPNIVDVKA